VAYQVRLPINYPINTVNFIIIIIIFNQRPAHFSGTPVELDVCYFEQACKLNLKPSGYILCKVSHSSHNKLNHISVNTTSLNLRTTGADMIPISSVDSSLGSLKQT